MQIIYCISRIIFLFNSNLFSVECSAGTFSETGKGGCLPCDQGSYTPNNAALSCQQCRAGMTTENVGSIAEYDCFGLFLQISSFFCLC